MYGKKEDRGDAYGFQAGNPQGWGLGRHAFRSARLNLAIRKPSASSSLDLIPFIRARKCPEGFTDDLSNSSSRLCRLCMLQLLHLHIQTDALYFS